MNEIDIVSLVKDYMSTDCDVGEDRELENAHLLVCVNSDDGAIDVWPGIRYFIVKNAPIFPMGDKVYVGAPVQNVNELPPMIIIWDVIALADPVALPVLVGLCRGRSRLSFGV